MGAPQYEQAGADVSGSGTAGTIPVWSTGTTLGDSQLVQSATAIYTTTRNFGAGTATPNAQLEVRTATSGGQQFRISNTADANSYWDIGRDNVTTGDLVFRSLTNERVRITTGGNVGIGTASPVASAKLTLGGAANSSIRLSYQTGGTTEVAFDQMNSATGEFRHSSGVSAGWGGFHTFYTDTTEKMRIDILTGNVGIGTAGPGQKLHVAGNGSTYIQVQDTSGSGVIGYIGASVSTGNVFDISSPNTTRFYVGGAERMRINSAGAAADSQVAIGTSSFTSGCSLTVAKSIDCSQSAQGLKLPATPGNADTQTLDAYQEQGWTPTLAGFGGTAPTVNFANYTRVGRLIFIEVELAPTGGATFSTTWGATTITLPFNAPRSTAIPANRNAASANAVTAGATVNLPTFALLAENLRISGVYAV